MKRPTRAERHHACARKRRYRSAVERQRLAYQCPLCGLWHLATKPARDA